MNTVAADRIEALALEVARDHGLQVDAWSAADSAICKSVAAMLLECQRPDIDHNERARIADSIARLGGLLPAREAARQVDFDFARLTDHELVLLDVLVSKGCGVPLDAPLDSTALPEALRTQVAEIEARRLAQEREQGEYAERLRADRDRLEAQVHILLIELEAARATGAAGAVSGGPAEAADAAPALEAAVDGAEVEERTAGLEKGAAAAPNIVPFPGEGPRVSLPIGADSWGGASRFDHHG
jgi:hypothetical protein